MSESIERFVMTVNDTVTSIKRKEIKALMHCLLTIDSPIASTTVKAVETVLNTKDLGQAYIDALIARGKPEDVIAVTFTGLKKNKPFKKTGKATRQVVYNRALLAMSAKDYLTESSVEGYTSDTDEDSPAESVAPDEF